MLTRNLFRRPRIKLEDTGDTQAQRPEIPEELYTACPVCKAMSAADELRKNASVCPKCGHHFRISARRRVELFCDEGTFDEMWTTLHGENPIGFPDYEKSSPTPANSPARSRPWSPANAGSAASAPASFSWSRRS